MSYNTELVEQIMATGSPASRDENDELYAAVIAGDEAAKKRMIEGNMPLVLLRVDAYIRCFPGVEHLRDDMASEGFLGLCTAVNKLSESEVREKSNATGYLNWWINSSIGQVVDSEGGVGASARTVRNHRKAGKAIVKQVTDDVDAVRPDVVVDPMAMTDLRDLIDACCESEEERMIVRMREEQYPCGSDREIAAALNLPYSTVYMMRREIYRRFLEKSGMRGEV
jgi:DNA-directed RNA polymerase sigma subunit (sigma70/sigma32)